MKNKIYMFFYGIGIRKYNKADLNMIWLENCKRINSSKDNSYYRHILVLQNKCIKKRLSKLCQK